jgi:hypothetical protein
MDTGEGDDDDPLSLHKYLYTETDPVDGLDPSGTADVYGAGGSYIDNPDENGQHFFKYASAKPRKHKRKK